MAEIIPGSEKRVFDKPDIEKLYKEYVTLSEELEASRPGGNNSCLVILGVTMFMPLLGAVCGGVLTAKNEGILALPVALVFLTIGVIWMYTAEAKANKKVEEINEIKPGFKEFYEKWRVKKSTEDLKATLALGAIVGLAASNVKIPNTKRRL